MSDFFVFNQNNAGSDRIDVAIYGESEKLEVEGEKKQRKKKKGNYIFKFGLYACSLTDTLQGSTSLDNYFAWPPPVGANIIKLKIKVF